MRCFVPDTAIGLFAAITLASDKAALTTSSLLPSTTLDNSPIFSASTAENGLHEYASSRTSERFPVSFGRYASVPMSDANPMSTSCSQPQASV